MRLLAVEACFGIAGLLKSDEVRELIKPTMMQLIEDRSWRVRYMVAEKYIEVR